jgi:hypothetical protein
MCHERFFRREERAAEKRGERLWDLFYRETEHNAPPVPMAGREEPDAEPDEPVTAGARETNDSH